MRTEKALPVVVVVEGALAPSTYDPPQLDGVIKPDLGRNVDYTKRLLAVEGEFEDEESAVAAAQRTVLLAPAGGRQWRRMAWARHQLQQCTEMERLLHGRLTAIQRMLEGGAKPKEVTKEMWYARRLAAQLPRDTWRFGSMSVGQAIVDAEDVRAVIEKVEWRTPAVSEEHRQPTREEAVADWKARKQLQKCHVREERGGLLNMPTAIGDLGYHYARRVQLDPTLTTLPSQCVRGTCAELQEACEALRRGQARALVDELGDSLYGVYAYMVARARQQRLPEREWRRTWVHWWAQLCEGGQVTPTTMERAMGRAVTAKREQQQALGECKGPREAQQLAFSDCEEPHGAQQLLALTRLLWGLSQYQRWARLVKAATRQYSARLQVEDPREASGLLLIAKLVWEATQQRRWNRLVAVSRQQEHPDLDEHYQHWHGRIQCTRWHSIREAAEEHHRQSQLLEAASQQLRDMHQQAQRQIKQQTTDQLNTWTQKARAAQARLLRRAERRRQQHLQAMQERRDWVKPSGGQLLERRCTIGGDIGRRVNAAKQQQQGQGGNLTVGGGWTPDARPAAMRRKKYRPSQLRPVREPPVGMLATLACLTMAAAVGAEVGAAWLPVAAAGAAASARLGKTCSEGEKGRQHHQQWKREEEEQWQQKHRRAQQEWEAAVQSATATHEQRLEEWQRTYRRQVEEEERRQRRQPQRDGEQQDQHTPEEERRWEGSQVAEVRRARFSATTTDVEILHHGRVVGEVGALVDSGAVVSCTPTRLVAHAKSQINRRQAAALCTADGSPMPGVRGSVEVHFRFKGSLREFVTQMQVLDSEVPFILGTDFLKREKAALNYAAEEICFPPSGGEGAMAAPLHTGRLSHTQLMAAVGVVPGLEEGLLQPEDMQEEDRALEVYATEDVIVPPGQYRHLDGRVQRDNRLHQVDTVLLESTVAVILDREALHIAESLEEQAAAALEEGVEPAKGAVQQAEQRSAQFRQQADRLRAAATAPAQFPAISEPWMDEEKGEVNVSTVFHNTGEEPVVVRKHMRIARATRVNQWQSGPRLLEGLEEDGAQQEGQSAVPAEIGGVALAPSDYTFKEGDWRYGLTGKEIVQAVLSSPERSQEFVQWHRQWYDKLIFGAELTQRQKTSLAIMLFAHKKIIAINPKAPSRIKGVEHRIPLDHSKVVIPHKGRMRRLSPAERQAQDEETQILLDNGLVRPSAGSPWSAATVMVPKKDGGRRYAIDYRMLNFFTVKDRQPIPRCDDLCDAVNGAFAPMHCPTTLPQRLPTWEETKQQGVPAAWQKAARKIAIMSSCDVASGFFGISLAEEDRHKTAFSTWTHGTLEWVVMAMGLHGAPQTFQRAMQKILQGLVWVICVIYIDDCAIFSESFEEHLDHLGKVFERLDAANISIKISKCVWGTTALPLLGHLIQAGKGVLPDAASCEALARADLPRTSGDIKSFLGACSYYRRFIPNFAVMAEPLRRIEKQFKTSAAQVRQAVAEDEEAVQGFTALKSALVNAPLLITPDFTKPFLIISDASKYFIGGCLCQRDAEGIERPVAFTSRPLRGSELNYAISDAEGLAMVHCCRLWRHFIVDTPCMCVTDHISLSSLMTQKEHASPRQARYALDLQEFDLTVVHRKGSDIKMSLADFLSRTPLAPVEFGEALRSNKLDLGRETQGFKGAAWAGSEAMARTIQGALEQAEVGVELKCHYNITPGGSEAKQLFSALHADVHRREQAWQRCRPADPDESRTLEMLQAICNIQLQQAPITRSAARQEQTTAATSKATAAKATAMAARRAGALLGKAVLQSLKEPSLGGAATAGDCPELLSESEEEEDEEEDEEGGAVSQRREWTMPSREEIKWAQREHPRWTAMANFKTTGREADTQPLRDFVHRYEASYECDEDGVLWRFAWRDEAGARIEPVKQIVLPPSLVERVVRCCHAGQEGGHLKLWKTYGKLRERFYALDLHKVTKRVIDTCPVCQLHGASQLKAPITGHYTAKGPAQVWMVDLLHLRQSREGYAYILVCVDVFSRYVELVPLKGGLTGEGGKEVPSSEDTAQAFLATVVQHWGLPKEIIADGGSEFKGAFKAMFENLEVKHSVTTPHHYAGHGLVERTNRSVNNTIAKLVQDEDDHWQRAVPWCQLALNGAPHKALQESGAGVLSPAEAHTGSRLHISIELDSNPDQLSSALQQRTVQDAIAAQMWIEQQRQKQEQKMEEAPSNKKRRLRTFELGDLVMVQYPDHDKLPQKLKEKYAGPYEVVAKPAAHSGAYVLHRKAGGMRAFTVHLNRMKRYQPMCLEGAAQREQDLPVPKSRLYEVARVLSHRQAPAGVEYQVLWEPCVDNDWDEEETTWEPEAGLKCPEKIAGYYKRATQVRMAAVEGVGTPGEVAVQADLLQGDPTTLIQRICAAVDLDPTNVLLVWASTPCETFSKADPSNITRNNHHRDHGNPERPPKSGDLSDLKVLKAVEHDRFLPRLQMMVAADRQRGLDYNFVFENPRASLRCRPYMQMAAWPRVVEVVRRTVHLCAFGHIYKKATDLWTSLVQWEPIGVTGDGQCHSRCGQGEWHDKGYRHHYALSVEPEREKQGKGVTARRNHIPAQLLLEVVRVAQQQGRANQRIVIDLCAGYQSVRAVCEQEGLLYIPVDIRYRKAGIQV